MTSIFRTDINALNKEIGEIKVAGAKLDARIQEAGVAVAIHFAQHKDTGLVNRLYLALPRGARKTAMASWLLAHFAVVANEGKNKVEMPFLFAKDKATNWEAAEADMWYDHKPEPTPDTVFDLQKMVRALILKASKADTIKGGDRTKLLALAAVAGIPAEDVPMFGDPVAAQAPTEEVAPATE